MIKSKKLNLIITSAILALALVIAIITGVQFHEFRTFQTEFNLDRVDETFKFSEFSPNLEGTVGDSNIYAIYGSQNTVALVRTSDAAAYATEIPATAKVGYVTTDTAQFAAAEATLGQGRMTEQFATVGAARVALEENGVDVVIMSYANAKTLKSVKSVTVAEFEVEKVPNMLILGGTHPNEPSGQLAATLFLENADVQRGNLFVVTETNKSAYSHSQPQEASAWYFDFQLEDGSTRTFKYGSRATNTVDQWPTPDVYAHSSGQKLSSTEVRNLNRAYPGNPNGNYTEQVAWAITNFVLTKNITMVFDLHEASPEYNVNNAVVYHQDADDILANATTWYGFEMANTDPTKLVSKVTGLNPSITQMPAGKPVIKENPSALYLHGLTHRELGDYTGAYVFLFETSNASQGKLHGAFVPELIGHEGYVDKFYAYAWQQTLEGNALLEAPAAGISERVARHVDAITLMITSFNDFGMTREKFDNFYDISEGGYIEQPTPTYVGTMDIAGMPSYTDVFVEGVAHYLQPITK